MSISISWDNSDKTIIRYDIKARWQWSELEQTYKRVFELMDTVDHNYVGTIACFVDRKVTIPGDTMRIFKGNVSKYGGHPKAGLTVIVGANQWMRSMFEMFRRAYILTGRPLDFAYAKTLDQARILISQDRLTKSQ